VGYLDCLSGFVLVAVGSVVGSFGAVGVVVGSLGAVGVVPVPYFCLDL
jgi:hypothetical protein